MQKTKSIILYEEDVGPEYHYRIALRVTYDGKIKEVGYRAERNLIKFRNARERALIWKIRRSSNICIFCGEIDFCCLQEHHIFGKKVDPVTITLCAN